MPASPSTPTGTTAPRAWVWGLARLAVYAYYRVDRIGGVLPDGALLLVANHPNTLIDPAVIQTTAGRRVRFLAKSTLFAWHPLSPLIRRSGAIPVYRKMDPGVDTSRNVEMFSAVAASLSAGEAICLFPEGTSHAHGRLEPLRTGAARMVLNSGAAGHPVTIVPVGLNFDALARFRSRASAVFGRPVDYADLVERYGHDEAAAVRALTDRIEQRLKRLMVEAEPRHDLPIVERIDRLYAAARGASRDARERLGRRRLIAAGMARLREQDPARLAELMRLVEEHLASLARFGLRERDLDHRIPAAEVVRFALREGLLALILGPLALASIVVFAAPYWLTDRIGRWAPNLQSRAVWQIIGGGLLHGAWIATIASLAGAQAGTATGVATGFGLVALAALGTLAVERESAVWRTTRAFFTLRRMPLRARGALRRRRAAVANVLDDVRAWVERTTRY
ncbi:MAG: 1-acyl-sn-glycerol-3-phosphate acyltransferase [Acidobacteria bacterium]|nr:1-acyl-sn-glycerol-3-phosphate acyltransferase [Acidobacteriota bacterium]